MLVMSPESTCDICLEPFALDGESRAPHAPQCGHVFCLKCIKSLTRTVCPMCRSPFNLSKVMKIHLDRRPQPQSTTRSQEIIIQSPLDPSIKLARDLHDRINSFIQTGASTSVAHTLTEDCKIFFRENSRTDHPDLYYAYQLFKRFLLSYYRALFPGSAAVGKSLAKVQVEAQAYHRSWETKCQTLTQEIDNLAETLQLERQTAQGLRDQLQTQEEWWNWKYEELRVRCAALQPNFSGFDSAEAIHRYAPSDPPPPMDLVRQHMVDHPAYEEQERLANEGQGEGSRRVRKVLRKARERGGVLV